MTQDSCRAKDFQVICGRYIQAHNQATPANPAGLFRSALQVLWTLRFSFCGIDLVWLY